MNQHKMSQKIYHKIQKLNFYNWNEFYQTANRWLEAGAFFFTILFNERANTQLTKALLLGAEDMT